jgi:hypothetical protein
MYITKDEYEGYLKGKNLDKFIGRLTWNEHPDYTGWMMILDVLDYDDSKASSTGGDRTVFVGFKNGIIKRTTLNLVRRGDVSPQERKGTTYTGTKYDRLLRAYPPALWDAKQETPKADTDVLYAGKIYTINIPGLGTQKVLGESAEAAWELLRSRCTIEEAFEKIIL